jgi:hypothetical protein
MATRAGTTPACTYIVNINTYLVLDEVECLEHVVDGDAAVDADREHGEHSALEAVREHEG